MIKPVERNVHSFKKCPGRPTVCVARLHPRAAQVNYQTEKYPRPAVKRTVWFLSRTV